MEVVENESYDYGRLWPDGTFHKLGGWHSEKSGRKEFDDKDYEVRNVPESLRPVFGRRLTKTRTETFAPEALPEETK